MCVHHRDANGMKQLALEVVARTLDPGQIRLLAEEFDRADNNNNGEVRRVSGTCTFCRVVLFDWVTGIFADAHT